MKTIKPKRHCLATDVFEAFKAYSGQVMSYSGTGTHAYVIKQITTGMGHYV